MNKSDNNQTPTARPRKDLSTAFPLDATFSCVHLPKIPNSHNKILLKAKNQLDATYHFIVPLIGSTCFGHYYAHHQELTTIMLITTMVVSFSVCCRLEVRCGYLQQTKNETTNVVINITVVSS